MCEDVGGSAFNAARTAARHGCTVTLMSVRGGDGAGQRVAAVAAASRIADASAVFLDRATPSHTTLFDRDGNVVAALADTGLYDIAFPKQMRRAKIRDEIGRADAVLTDTDLPETALKRLVAAAGERPIFAVATSPGKASRLAPLLPELACLFVTRRAAETLIATTGSQAAQTPSADASSLVSALRDLGVGRCVVALVEGAAIAFDAAKAWRFDMPSRPDEDDTTCEILAGGAVAALSGGRDFPEAVREGVAATMVAAGASGAPPGFTVRALKAALSQVAQPIDLTEKAPFPRAEP